jgi:Tol biopolymer transport system component
MQQSFSINNFGICPSASNPGDGVSEIVMSLSHQRGKMSPKKQNNTKQKNTTMCLKFKCNTVSVSFSACSCSLVVVSSKEERKKKSGDSSVNGYLRLWRI